MPDTASTPTDEHVVDANPQLTLETYADAPDGACVRWEQCGNEVPGNGKMCGECLDDIRREECSYDRL